MRSEGERTCRRGAAYVSLDVERIRSIGNCQKRDQEEQKFPTEVEGDEGGLRK